MVKHSNRKSSNRAAASTAGQSYTATNRTRGDRSHLVPMQVTDKNGHIRTVYVNPNDQASFNPGSAVSVAPVSASTNSSGFQYPEYLEDPDNLSYTYMVGMQKLDTIRLEFSQDTDTAIATSMAQLSAELGYTSRGFGSNDYNIGVYAEGTEVTKSQSPGVYAPDMNMCGESTLSDMGFDLYTDSGDIEVPEEIAVDAVIVARYEVVSQFSRTDATSLLDQTKQEFLTEHDEEYYRALSRIRKWSGEARDAVINAPDGATYFKVVGPQGVDREVTAQTREDAFREAGVYDAPPGTKFLVYISHDGEHDSGLAVLNTGDAPSKNWYS